MSYCYLDSALELNVTDSSILARNVLMNGLSIVPTVVIRLSILNKFCGTQWGLDAFFQRT